MSQWSEANADFLWEASINDTIGFAADAGFILEECPNCEEFQIWGKAYDLVICENCGTEFIIYPIQEKGS